MKKKKPDAVVWDETTQQYVAKLLPYASSNSGPIIELPNVDAFKQQGVQKASKMLKAEWDDLQSQLSQFVKMAQQTQRVYAAQYKFEPIVGETYYLYTGQKGDFLSIIPPEQWNKELVARVRLRPDYKWEEIDREP
ncbi:MAG: DUF2452 domain-containing protein [Flavobacteriaceae bacterium]